MKKIAILVDKFPPNPCGGIASAHYSLYTMFKSKGYNVKVYTYLEKPEHYSRIDNDKDIFRFGASKIELKYLEFASIIKHKINKWFFRHKVSKDLAYQLLLVKQANYGSKKINKYLQRFNPDFVFIPDFGAPGYSLKKIKKATYFHLSHHNPIRFIKNPLFEEHSIQDAVQAIKYEQNSLSIIDKVICPSLYMKNVFENTFTFKGQVLLIPNMINPDFINSIHKNNIHNILNIKKSWPVIYIPSAGSKLKGAQFVIEIIRRISNGLDNCVGFYLSGDLSETQKFELSKYPKFHIYSPGKVNLKENISSIKDCTLCISPTLLECFGMALLEAQFCNIPCIAFDVGGNKEIINDKNGFLVPYLDVETLIHKSLELLTASDLYLHFEQNTKVTQNRFSTETIFEKYKKLIE